MCLPLLIWSCLLVFLKGERPDLGHRLWPLILVTILPFFHTQSSFWHCTFQARILWTWLKNVSSKAPVSLNLLIDNHGLTEWRKFYLFPPRSSWGSSPPYPHCDNCESVSQQKASDHGTVCLERFISILTCIKMHIGASEEWCLGWFWVMGQETSAMKGSFILKWIQPASECPEGNSDWQRRDRLGQRLRVAREVSE